MPYEPVPDGSARINAIVSKELRDEVRKKVPWGYRSRLVENLLWAAMEKIEQDEKFLASVVKGDIEVHRK